MSYQLKVCRTGKSKSCNFNKEFFVSIAAAVEGARSICSDGTFLYATSFRGKGLSKIGSGRNGSLRSGQPPIFTPVFQPLFIKSSLFILFRGFVYKTNSELPQGRVAYSNDLLVFRPIEFDRDVTFERFALLIDTNSLQASCSQFYSYYKQ